MKNIFTLFVLLLVGAGLLGSYKFLNIEANLSWHKANNHEKLQLLVDHDFENSLKKNEFPKEWLSLSGYKINFHSAICEYYFKNIKIPMPPAHDGKYIAKIDIVDIPDSENPGLLVQISLIEKATGNKIEEFSKDYYLNEFEKVPEFARIRLNFNSIFK